MAETLRPPMDESVGALDRVGGWEGVWRNLTRQRELAIGIAALLMFILLAIFARNFTQPNNLLNVARQISLIAIIGVGMTYLFIAGEIDLSVGSMLGFSVVTLAYFVVRLNLNIWLAMALTVLAGCLVGFINGFLTTRFGIPSFIVTLGMLSILRGAALIISGGWPAMLQRETAFIQFTAGMIANTVPAQVIWMAVIMLVGGLVLARTRFGYHVYATGGNRQAARLTGIDTDRVKLISFVLTGGLTAVAGCLLAGWIGSANPLAGLGYELDVIAAVIIGGTSLFGGAGSILGTFLGAAITGMITNGLVLLGAPPAFEQISKGIIIVLAVLVYVIIQRRQR